MESRWALKHSCAHSLCAQLCFNAQQNLFYKLQQWCLFPPAPDGSLTLSAPTVLLTDSPPMELQLFEDGVCLLPSSGPTPRGLILMWRRGDKRMEPYIWNGSLLSATILETSFKAITRRLAGVWSKVCNSHYLLSEDLSFEVTFNPCVGSPWPWTGFYGNPPSV